MRKRFKIGWLLVLLLLTACAATATSDQPQTDAMQAVTEQVVTVYEAPT